MKASTKVLLSLYVWGIEPPDFKEISHELEKRGIDLKKINNEKK
jgi:hypothetical protein